MWAGKPKLGSCLNAQGKVSRSLFNIFLVTLWRERVDIADQTLSILVVITVLQHPRQPVMCVCAQRRARGWVRAVSKTASDSSIVQLPGWPQQTGLIARLTCNNLTGRDTDGPLLQWGFIWRRAAGQHLPPKCKWNCYGRGGKSQSDGDKDEVPASILVFILGFKVGLTGSGGKKRRRSHFVSTGANSPPWLSFIWWKLLLTMLLILMVPTWAGVYRSDLLKADGRQTDTLLNISSYISPHKDCFKRNTQEFSVWFHSPKELWGFGSRLESPTVPGWRCLQGQNWAGSHLEALAGSWGNKWLPALSPVYFMLLWLCRSPPRSCHYSNYVKHLWEPLPQASQERGRAGPSLRVWLLWSWRADRAPRPHFPAAPVITALIGRFVPNASVAITLPVT